MSDLYWPGERRAGACFTEAALLAAMVRVEQAWLDALAGAGRGERVVLPDIDADELDPAAVESGGNPVTPLVAILRERSGNPWVHRGLTSQDVVDTALVVMLQGAQARLLDELAHQVRRLCDLAREHRDTPMVARTLAQHAVPTTFGLTVATWLTGVLDAADDLAALTFPVQLGGAAGTHAAIVELGLDPARVLPVFATRLFLDTSPPWHTTRRPITRAGDALVACTDAWGRVANDVVTLSRPEIGEVAEGSGGGSSTMPHKANPVLSTLVRRAALTTPGLAATLHLAAAAQEDARATGAWHAEWATLRDLARRTLVAGSQTTELLDDLRVHPEAMAATLAAAEGVRSEQETMAALVGHEPSGDYLGAAPALVEAVLDRAARSLTTLKETNQR